MAEEDQIQTAVRLPKSWFARLDKLAEQLSQPGLTLSRTDALRMAIARGMAEMESELQVDRL